MFFWRLLLLLVVAGPIEAGSGGATTEGCWREVPRQGGCPGTVWDIRFLKNGNHFALHFANKLS